MIRFKRIAVPVTLTAVVVFVAIQLVLRKGKDPDSVRFDEVDWYSPVDYGLTEAGVLLDLLNPNVLQIDAAPGGGSAGEPGTPMTAEEWDGQSEVWTTLELPAELHRSGEDDIRVRFSPAEPITASEIGWLKLRFEANDGNTAQLRSYRLKDGEQILGNRFRFPLRSRRGDAYLVSGSGFYGELPISAFELHFESGRTKSVMLSEARLVRQNETLPTSGVGVVRQGVGGDYRDALYLRPGAAATASVEIPEDSRLVFAVAAMGKAAAKIVVLDTDGVSYPLFEASDLPEDVWEDESIAFPESLSGPVTFRFEASGSGTEGESVFVAHPMVRATAADRRPSVVYVVVDALRAQQLGAYGYRARPTSPFIDQLAGESTVFDRCFAAGTGTYVAVPSILTGTSPEVIGISDPGERLPDSITTLAQLLSDAGYMTASVLATAYAGRLVGLDRGFMSSVESFAFSNELPAEELFDYAANVIDRWRGAPVFLYIHLKDTHTPYSPPPEYLEIVGPGPEASAVYDAEVRYVDDALRRFLDRVAADAPILVFSADHGEMLGERGLEGHVMRPYQPVHHIPLIFHAPRRGVRPTRIATPVSATDIAPTIAGMVGLPPAETMDGKDLTRPGLLAENRLLHVAWPISLVWWPYKYTKDAGGGAELLFDLENDPREEENLAEHEREIIDKLWVAWETQSATLSQKRQRLAATRPDDLLIDPESMRLLETLGYIEKN